jgi:hypothetical protein
MVAPEGNQAKYRISGRRGMILTSASRDSAVQVVRALWPRYFEQH